MRPCASAGRRVRTLACNAAREAASITATAGFMMPVPVVACQKSAKFSKVRWTVIVRVSIASSYSLEEIRAGEAKQEDRCSARPVDHVLDQVEKRRLGPVEIVEDHDERTLGRG